MRSIDGKPVSDEQIQTWADEAERGYSAERVARGRKPLSESGPSVIVPVRVDPDLLEAVAKRAGDEHLNRSEAIRAALREWAHVA